MDAVPGGRPVLWRRLAAELVGTVLLAALVIGSGIAAQRLSPADLGLQLAENAGATAAGLYAIILVVGPVSGAHLNPAVTILRAITQDIRPVEAAGYVAAQIIGCAFGAVLANAMFAEPAVAWSTHHRASGPHLLAEVVATAGLLLVIYATDRSGQSAKTPAAVAAFIGAAYWFTSSTSFANPAITVGRMLSDTFAGIAPASAPAFVASQGVGIAAGYALVRLLYPAPSHVGAPLLEQRAAPADTALRS